MTYLITPLTSGEITVGGASYDGTKKETTAGVLKNGLVIGFKPNKVGACALTFIVSDEYGGAESKTIEFNVSNPELTLSLSGVNTGTNYVNLGEAYKFYFNCAKEYYSGSYTYWIELLTANAGIIGTSDITPRGARSGGSQLVTGSLNNNGTGLSTGEIRFSPSNPDYINQNVQIKITVRDELNNTKEKIVTFNIKTSAISINVTRNTSIPVQSPYQFFFTVSKPNYSGKFKYNIVGWASGDKIEISSNGIDWETYYGGLFQLPHPDHTYVRYTPAGIGTVPMKLFIYDDVNTEAVQDLIWDVKAPEVKLTADVKSRNGYVEEYLPFNLTATDGKNESMTATFKVETSGFNGDIKFNNQAVSPMARSSSHVVSSGSTNKLEIMSRRANSYSISTTVTNRFNQSASVSSTINVSDIPTYSLTTSSSGSGSIILSPSSETGVYKAGTTVTLTASPSSEWQFVRWEGDLTGTSTSATLTMNSNKTVTAVFQKSSYTLSINSPNGSVTVSPNKSSYSPGEVVTLTAVPATNYKFVKWSGDLSGTTATTTITMNSNKSVTANFTRPVYRIYIEPIEYGRVELTPDKVYYEHGETVKALYVSDVFDMFGGWYGSVTQGDRLITIYMDSDKTLGVRMISDGPL